MRGRRAAGAATCAPRARATTVGSAASRRSISAAVVVRPRVIRTPSAARAAEGVRITLGRTTTAAEIDRLLAALPTVVARARGAQVAAPAARRPRIAVAMSGGVDSSTAAALLLESGAEVVGVTLKLY